MATAMSKKFIIDTNYVQVRETAGDDGKIKYVVQKGSVVKATKMELVKGIVWYYIVYGSTEGWISSSKVKAYDGTDDTKINSYNNVNKSITVTATTLNIRSGAGTSYKVVGTVKKGATGTATRSKKVGGVTWYYVTIGSVTGWCSGSYLKLTNKSSSTNATKNSKSSKNNKKTTPKKTNTISIDSKKLAKKIASALNTVYDEEVFLNCTTRLFGSPHQFLGSVDYRLNENISLGRQFVENVMGEAPLVYFIPGKPNYLPNVSTSEKNAINQLFGDSTNAEGKLNQTVLNSILKDKQKDIRYFDFTEAYNDYMRYVNLLCRMCSIYLGIGDLTAPTTGAKYKYYNWKNYKWRNDYTKAVNGKSVFEKGATTKKQKKKNILSELEEAFYGKYSYVEFYVNPTSSFRESSSNSTRDSQIKPSVETAEEYAKELQFLSGQSKVASTVWSGVTSGTSALGNVFGSNSNNIFSKIVSSSAQVISGSNIAFPELWSESDYGKTIDFTIDFISPYGTKEAIYLNCLVPLCHLLALVLPKNTSPNSYSSPFIVKTFAPGIVNCELGIVESLEIEKGGEGYWSVDGLPTKITCTVRVKELYTTLSMNKTTQFKKFFKNTALMNFLAVACGVDVTRPQLLLKVETMVATLLGGLKDIPSDIKGSIIQAIKNMGASFFQF